MAARVLGAGAQAWGPDVPSALIDRMALPQRSGTKIH